MDAAPRSDAAVLATVAAALDTGAVLLDGHEVVLANDAALALRVVRGNTLALTALVRVVREARRRSGRVQQDVDLPWGATTRPVRVTAAPVEDSDVAVLLLEDIAERLRVEAVRRDFVANVSHELKTPLGALQLIAETLRDSADDAQAIRHFSDRLLLEVARMSRLVQELLDLSRLQGGEPLPTPQRVLVQGVLDEAVSRVRLAAERAGVVLTAGDGGDLEVWGDERSLVTALTNLLDNGIAYSTPGGRVAVGARLRPGGCGGDGGDEVEIAVSDDGVGIAPADVERIFERFYRADPARSRATGGTGLGLAIAKHAVENSGGSISVWSRQGVGSTFTLHLSTPPVTPGPRPADNPASRQVPSA